MAHAYHQLGYIHYNLNEFDTALEYLRKSLSVLDKYKKMYASAIADTYSMIGQVLFGQKNDLQIALENMQRALEIRLKEYNPEPQTLAKNYGQIDETLLYLKRHDEALSNLNKALKIQHDSLPNYHMDLAATYSTISHVHHDRGEYKEALSYCKKALDIYQHCLRNNHPSLATVHTNMANNLGELKRFDEAIVHANKAIDISRSYLSSDHENIKERQRILQALQTTQRHYQTRNSSQ